jgi:hypothetical protein
MKPLENKDFHAKGAGGAGGSALIGIRLAKRRRRGVGLVDWCRRRSHPSFVFG